MEFGSFVGLCMASCATTKYTGIVSDDEQHRGHYLITQFVLIKCWIQVKNRIVGCL